MHGRLASVPIHTPLLVIIWFHSPLYLQFLLLQCDVRTLCSCRVLTVRVKGLAGVQVSVSGAEPQTASAQLTFLQTYLAEKVYCVWFISYKACFTDLNVYGEMEAAPVAHFEDFLRQVKWYNCGVCSLSIRTFCKRSLHRKCCFEINERMNKHGNKSDSPAGHLKSLPRGKQSLTVSFSLCLTRNRKKEKTFYSELLVELRGWTAVTQHFISSIKASLSFLFLVSLVVTLSGPPPKTCFIKQPI